MATPDITSQIPGCTSAEGGPQWRSTGLTYRQQALRLARRWEAQQNAVEARCLRLRALPTTTLSVDRTRLPFHAARTPEATKTLTSTSLKVFLGDHGRSA